MILPRFLPTDPIRIVNTAWVRGALRALALTVLLCVLGGALARGSEVGAEAPPAATAAPAMPADETPAATPELAEKIAHFFQTGVDLWQKGQRDGAERAFSAALQVNAPESMKRQLLLDLARVYADGGESLKAIAVLEKFLVAFPKDEETPALLLQLGLLYRQVGAHNTATARFFQVLNSTLQLAPENLDAYRKLAMKARLEIAETFAQQGDVDEARKYFSRLQLLDLDPADRERVRFREAQLRYAQQKWADGEIALRDFLGEFPRSGYAAEARYMRARSLDALGRKPEAVQEVIELLRSEEPERPEFARQADYWKRRTGNELANQFYEQGDFLGALSIYQALARAGSDPAWCWPAVYQVGLCFERLKMPTRAAEAYRAIVEPDPAPPAGTQLPETLVSLQDMAKWRLAHLDWIEDFAKRLQGLSAHPDADS